MAIYDETCPLGLTPKKITFTVYDGRRPSPTKGCICEGDKQEQAIRLVAGVATIGNLAQAIGNSILTGGEPVEYQSYEIRNEHNSVINEVG